MFFRPDPNLKMTWPEVVNMDAEEAKKIIANECTDVTIYIIGENQPVTMDYRLDRVRIIKNNENKVLLARRG